MLKYVYFYSALFSAKGIQDLAMYIPSQATQGLLKFTSREAQTGASYRLAMFMIATHIFRSHTSRHHSA